VAILGVVIHLQSIAASSTSLSLASQISLFDG